MSTLLEELVGKYVEIWTGEDAKALKYNEFEEKINTIICGKVLAVDHSSLKLETDVTIGDIKAKQIVYVNHITYHVIIPVEKGSGVSLSDVLHTDQEIKGKTMKLYRSLL